MKIIGNKNALHTPEFHKKKLIERRIRITIISLIVLIVVVAPILLLRNKNFQVVNLEIKGNVVTKSEEIQAIVDEGLSGNYLWVIPRSNSLLYPKNGIIKNLLDREPRLSKVEISAPDVKSIVVSVSERTPTALYCKDITNTSTPVSCYFIDANGFIFSEAPAFSGGVYFVYTSEPLLDAPLKVQFMEAKKFKLLDVFIKSLADAGLYPKVFVFKKDEYHLILSNGADIMWKESQNLDQIRSNLVSFVEDASFRKDKNNLSNILYIDLRFGNKIFYKYK
ncbi:MAG: hypothetical protein WAV25_01650 [Minisyncoccia bacterium]